MALEPVLLATTARTNLNFDGDKVLQERPAGFYCPFRSALKGFLLKIKEPEDKACRGWLSTDSKQLLRCWQGRTYFFTTPVIGGSFLPVDAAG